jgi:hypothetical protein
MKCYMVPAGVKVLLGLCNPPCSWISMWAPPLSGGIIAPYVDSLLCYGSSDDINLSLKMTPKSKVCLCIYTFSICVVLTLT